MTNAPGNENTPPTTSLGLDANLEGLLAYLFGFVSGLVLLLTEKEHAEVRFHAAQSLVLSIGMIAVFVVLMGLSIIPVLGLLFWLVQILLGLASFALWIYLLVKGYQLEHVKLPVVGEYAERWAASEAFGI